MYFVWMALFLNSVIDFVLIYCHENEFRRWVQINLTINLKKLLSKLYVKAIEKENWRWVNDIVNSIESRNIWNLFVHPHDKRSSMSEQNSTFVINA